MKVRITGNGVFGAEGEAPIGLEVEVPHVPNGWAGRCVVVDDAKPKTMIVNPAENDELDEALDTYDEGGKEAVRKSRRKRS